MIPESYRPVLNSIFISHSIVGYLCSKVFSSSQFIPQMGGHIDAKLGCVQWDVSFASDDVCRGDWPAWRCTRRSVHRLNIFTSQKPQGNMKSTKNVRTSNENKDKQSTEKLEKEDEWERFSPGRHWSIVKAEMATLRSTWHFEHMATMATQGSLGT